MHNDCWSTAQPHKILIARVTFIGQPAMVTLSIIGRRGPSSLDISDVGLVIVSGPETVSKSKITDMGNGELLVTVDAVPAGEFVLSLKGTDRISNTEFQRQSTTQMSISKVNVQVGLLVDILHI